MIRLFYHGGIDSLWTDGVFSISSQEVIERRDRRQRTRRRGDDSR